jgi:hypothetical protein
MAITYTKVAYTDDKAQTHRIRLSTQTVAAQATAPGTTYDGSPVESRRSSRLQTLQIRGLRLERTASGKVYKTFLPICLLADYNTVTVGDTITVGGVAWKIDRKVPEEATR